MNSSPDIVFKYFPQLSEWQRQQFAMLGTIYEEWNAKLNLISRRDVEWLYERHILHSLAIAKCVQFPNSSTILDVGTGGGFPGIPLAIMFPNSRFILADSIGKKIRAVENIVSRLTIQNVDIHHVRVENLKQNYNYAVCRAVAPIPVLLSWIAGKVSDTIFLLKGGNIDAELSTLRHGRVQVHSASQWFDEEFFREKKVIVLSPA